MFWIIVEWFKNSLIRHLWAHFRSIGPTGRIYFIHYYRKKMESDPMYN